MGSLHIFRVVVLSMNLQGQQVVDHIVSELKKLAKKEPGKNVCVDFDKVINHYETGDPIHQVQGPLDPGIALVKLIKRLGLKPIILTARPKQYHAELETFLKKQGADAPVTNVKPPALMYIDDMARRWPENFGAKMKKFEKEAQENGGDGSMNMLDGGRYKSLASHESGVKGMKWGKKKARDRTGNVRVGGVSRQDWLNSLPTKIREHFQGDSSTHTRLEALARLQVNAQLSNRKGPLSNYSGDKDIQKSIDVARAALVAGTGKYAAVATEPFTAYRGDKKSEGGRHKEYTFLTTDKDFASKYGPVSAVSLPRGTRFAFGWSDQKEIILAPKEK